MRAWLIAALLLTAGLAGCLGGEDDPGEEVQKARAEVFEGLGGVEGIVTDEAIQPIVGAQVTLLESNQTTQTVSDGSFAISGVEPGSYTLTVRAEGVVSGRQAVEVQAGQVATVDLVLSRLTVEEPYTQTWELAGFFECGFAAGAYVPPPVNVSQGIISYPVCGDLNAATGNATNDRFDHHLRTDGPIQSLVIETTWDPGLGGFSDQLWVDIVPEGFHCGSISTCNWSLIDHWGPNPLVGQIDRERFESVQTYFEEQCEDGEDEWCGYSFFDSGWPLWLRVYPRWECQPAGPQACVLAQQSFTHYVTAFYHEPAPEGYSLAEGG